MACPRVVLDTSVMVSGLLGGKAGLSVLQQWRNGRFTLIISPAIYAEYDAVLKRPKFGLPGWLVRELLDFIRERADWVEPGIQMAVARDPHDDKFLEVAVCGKADYVISEDRDLLDLMKVENIPIIPPWEFILEL